MGKEVSMAQIFTVTENQSKEYIKFDIADEDFDFLKAKQLAKKTAFEKCDSPMILSWKNGKTGESIKELRQKDTNIDHLSKPCQNNDYIKSVNGLLERASISQQ